MFWPFRSAPASEPEAAPEGASPHVENADGVCGNCGLDMSNLGDSKCRAAPESAARG